MKFPTKDNIDRWMFDYTEGNLSPDQETVLENYILNNPDLEVDLDAWRLSSVSTEELVYTAKESSYKKRRILPFFIGGVVSLLILFMLTWNYTSNESAKSVNENVATTKGTRNLKTENSTSTVNSSSEVTSSEIQNSPLASNLPTYQVSELQTTNYSTLNSSNASQELGSFSLGNSEKESFKFENATNQNLVDSRNSQGSNSQRLVSINERLKTNTLNSFVLDGYQVRNQELITNEDLDQVNGAGISVNTPKILVKIEKILSKDVALTNVPDHTYALPELSDIDVLFSNIGATSKARFYSVTRARWIGNESQQKLSQQFSFDSYSRATKSAFGLQANYDYFGNGVIQNWNVGVLFSPKIALSRNITLEPAMRFKMGNKLLNQAKVTNNSAVEFETGRIETFNFNENDAIGRRLLYRDLDAGLTINTSLFYIGFQTTNLLRYYDNIFSNSDSTTTERALRTTSLVAGTQYISRNEKFVFSPYVYANFNKTQNALYAGFSMKLSKLMVGASYGNNKALTGLIGLSTNRFSLFAQTTYAPSTILTMNALTHQLTVRFNSSTSRKARRYITL